MHVYERTIKVIIVRLRAQSKIPIRILAAGARFTLAEVK